jgi:tRNA pseudouridine55 synthase
MQVSGFLLVNKPQDWTSHDVVAKLRGLFHKTKIGHGGTLDPLATGLLVVALGQATKYLHYFLNDDKEYVAQFRLGSSTNTQDSTGETRQEYVVENITMDQVRIACEAFLGAIEQIPPMFSAKKIKGKRLYKLARKGQEVEREPKEITIHHLELRSFDGINGELLIRCSKGTYVRTLCHDLGEKLGVGAHMTGLVRQRSGHFIVEEAHLIEKLVEMDEYEREQLLHPIDQAIAHYI